MRYVLPTLLVEPVIQIVFIVTDHYRMMETMAQAPPAAGWASWAAREGVWPLPTGRAARETAEKNTAGSYEHPAACTLY